MNQKRKTRRPNGRPLPLVVTPDVIRRLRILDFAGRLTSDEIELAKKLGIYRYDGYIKDRRLRRLERGGTDEKNHGI